jgi:hypothetical protein
MIEATMSGCDNAGMTSNPTPVFRPSGVAVQEFLAAVADKNRRADAVALSELMQDVTGEPPAMWGPSIVGFGSYHYRYASGRSGEAPLAGFSPRSQHLVVYLVSDYVERYPALLGKLGPHKTGKACLYLKRLSSVDQVVLRELIERSFRVARGVGRANAAALRNQGRGKVVTSDPI